MAAILATRAPLALRATTASRTQSRRSLVVRATEGDKEAAPSSGTVFYKGNEMTGEEVRVLGLPHHKQTHARRLWASQKPRRAVCVAAVWCRVAALPPPPPPPL